MVGFRVFDVGLLVAWLIWFFRLRDDDGGADPPDGGGGGGGDGRKPGPRRGPGGDGIRLPDGPWRPGWRRRDGHRPPQRRPSRFLPSPARVRSPTIPRRAPSRSKAEPG